MTFEDGDLHKCEACDDYYRHDDYKCNKYTKWGDVKIIYNLIKENVVNKA